MQVILILAIVIFFSWQILVSVLAGLGGLLTFLLTHLHIIVPTLLFGWSWWRFGLMPTLIVAILTIILIFVGLTTFLNRSKPREKATQLPTDQQSGQKLITPVRPMQP